MVKMLAVISPAKTLDFENEAPIDTTTEYRFSKQSKTLIEILRRQSTSDIKKLMGLSDMLAQLNVDRYKAWQPKMTANNSKQALFAFQGDVYTGLAANTLTHPQISNAQSCLRILSGLYGLLRPFDAIQPYRLEMGIRLQNDSGANLYEFWNGKITQALNDDLQDLGADVLINLASLEYFKAVDTKQLNAKIITPVFKDEKNGKFKIISFYAKKARGLMVRYMIEQEPKTLKALQKFDYAGYQFSPEESDELTWVFKRNERNVG